VKQPRIPASMLLSRIRREIAYLKAVLRKEPNSSTSCSCLAKPQVREILIAEKMKHWWAVAKCRLIDPTCPTWRAREN
jgi:hypothetical protein